VFFGNYICLKLLSRLFGTIAMEDRHAETVCAMFWWHSCLISSALVRPVTR
jgi:hypothetical protein